MRVAILGAGGMGNVHARQYRKMDSVELGFFELEPDRRAPFAEKWSATEFASAAEATAWADVVDVCLPTLGHLDAGLQAVAAGRAVFMEKPMAATFADAVRLAEAADKAGVPLSVGQVVRYFPEFATGRRIVANGGVGKPAAARTRRGGKMPASPWFADHEQSGGVLLDLAIHDFDWLRWTLGEVKHLYSRSVGAATGKGPDYALTILTFDSGAIGHVESTWMDPAGFRTAFEVCGSDGMVQFDSREVASLRTHTADGVVLESNLSAGDDPYLKEIQGFLDAVAAGTPPPVTTLDGIMAVSIAEAAVESARSGRVVAPARP